MNNGYSKGLNFQNVGNFRVISSCSEKRYSSICLKIGTHKIFQIRENILPKDGHHMGYSLFPSVSSDLWFL